MRYLKCLLVIVGMCSAQYASAINITLSQMQINQMVSLQFPQQQVQQGLMITLENPVVDLFANTQTIAFHVKITVSDGNNILSADVKANSPIHYSREALSFYLTEAVIEKFTVLENTLVNDAQSLSNMQIWLHSQIPNIVELNKNMFNLGFVNAAPRALTIVDGGVLVAY